MSKYVRISYANEADKIFCEVCGESEVIPQGLPKKVKLSDKTKSKEKLILNFAERHKNKCKAVTEHLINKKSDYKKKLNQVMF